MLSPASRWRPFFKDEPRLLLLLEEEEVDTLDDDVVEFRFLLRPIRLRRWRTDFPVNNNNMSVTWQRRMRTLPLQLSNVSRDVTRPTLAFTFAVRYGRRPRRGGLGEGFLGRDWRTQRWAATLGVGQVRRRRLNSMLRSLLGWLDSDNNNTIIIFHVVHLYVFNVFIGQEKLRKLSIPW